MSASDGHTALLVREAEPAEAPALREMIVGIAAGTGHGESVASTAASIARDGFGPDRAFVPLLAVRGEGYLGMAIYYPEYSTWRAERGACLLDLYVAPEARGEGVGRRLVAEAVRRTRAQGAGYLRLAVDADNAGAREFYRRLGFAEAGRERLFFLEGEPFSAIAGAS